MPSLVVLLILALFLINILTISKLFYKTAIIKAVTPLDFGSSIGY